MSVIVESGDEITISVPDGSTYLIDGEEIKGPATIVKKQGATVVCVSLGETTQLFPPFDDN